MSTSPVRFHAPTPPPDMLDVDDAAFLTSIARTAAPTTLDDLFEQANLDGFAGLDDSDTLARTFRPLP